MLREKKRMQKWFSLALGCHHDRCGVVRCSKGLRGCLPPRCSEDFISLSTVMSLECPRSRSAPATADRRHDAIVKSCPRQLLATAPYNTANYSNTSQVSTFILQSVTFQFRMIISHA
ncbi:jg10677 [Pararge aegeria aegeria]|uniref:Jg10677 protein n=1 Tax=Pararge aegeria aegeria TaxID=348720 RepID=A0A8S4S0S4_9NEOP|nr:jg10677 [Pararge aegeria aegeria]